MSSVGFRPPSRAARGTADGPRRLHLPRRRRPRSVRGQGQVDPQARALLLPGPPAARRGPLLGADGRPRGAAPQDRRPGRADRARGGLRHRERERGPHPGGQPRPHAPAALQRAAARRQELPLHRDQPGRGVSAGLLHPREPPPRPALLRALLERLQGARDAQPDREDLPEPPLRGPRAGEAVGRPVPRLPHQAMPGAVRRLHLQGGLPGPDRPDHRLPVGALPRAGARARGADARRGGGPGVRARGRHPQPPLGGAAPDGAPVRHGRLGGDGGRARHRDGGRLGQRPGAAGARRRPAGPPVVLPRHRRAPTTRRRC